MTAEARCRLQFGPAVSAGIEALSRDWKGAVVSFHEGVLVAHDVSTINSMVVGADFRLREAIVMRST